MLTLPPSPAGEAARQRGVAGGGAPARRHHGADRRDARRLDHQRAARACKFTR